MSPAAGRTGEPGLWHVPGQDAVAGVLRRAATSGEVGHAWAFLGPPGVGQEQAARALTATLVCDAGEPPCGACDACRRSARGTHSAYFEFVPTGAVHRVSDVRERWLRIATRSPGEGGWKVLRVVAAERMNEAAANAFLKGLEEPPPRTVWLLDVADPDDLPDTILSRCRAVRFVPLGPGILDAEAQRQGIAEPAERALAVRACLGSPARLRTLAVPPKLDARGEVKEPGGLDDLRSHREIPRRLAGPGFALVAAYDLENEVKRRTAAFQEAAKAERDALAEGYGEAAPRAVLKELDDRHTRQEREQRTQVVRDALDDIACWYRDVLLVHAGAAPEQLVHGDDLEGLRADAACLAPAETLVALDLVLDARANLERNVQTRLALEALFMDLTAMLLRG